MLHEYLTKGLALGVLSYLGYTGQPMATAVVYGLVLLGLVVSLWLASQRAKSVNPTTWTLSYIIYLLLEFPVLHFAAVLAGLMVGALLITFVLQAWTVSDLFFALGLGVATGVALIAMRFIAQKNLRRVAVLVLGAGAITLIIFYLFRDDVKVNPTLFGLHLLLAIPVLYILTIAGRTEETEIEIGLVCVLLGLALWVMLGPAFQIMAMLIPLVIYVGYTQYLLRDMQAFKALLRGMGHARLGATAEALTSFRRALHFSPRHQAARQELWKVHRQIDLRQIHQDQRLLQLIDFDMCLQRARDILFSENLSNDQIAEAKQLLDLVVDQRPSLRPAVMYYRAVAYTHAREFDKAETTLRQLLDAGEFSPEEEASRNSVIIPAWQLALLQHTELRKRVGEPLLAAGQRMNAVAAIEKATGDTTVEDVLALKAKLYEGITLAEYNREAGTNLTQQASAFDHRFVYDRGLALLDDPQQYERGIELLAMAVRGQPRHAAAVWKIAADAATKHGNSKLASQALNEVKVWAGLLGVKEISPESQAAYFATVKQLGEQAYHEAKAGRQSPQVAIDNLLLASEATESGVDTLRMLAELFEMQGNVVQTMHYNEQCLMYDGKNPQYLERKERIYVSLTTSEVTANADKLSKLIDVGYLVKKSKELLDLKNAGLDQLNWARHLAELLTVATPEKVAGWVLIGRCFLRLGQTENGVKALGYAVQSGISLKPTGEDLEQWYLACRIMGDHHLQQAKYAEALECYQHFSQSTRSGAETYYKMGQAAEGLGDRAAARRHYLSANMYDHPNKYEVTQALERLSG
jgi:tetratricopeptide (TPR) repeat protein